MGKWTLNIRFCISKPSTCVCLCWKTWDSSAVVIVRGTEAVATQKRVPTSHRVVRGGFLRKANGLGGNKRFQVCTLGVFAAELYLYTYMMLWL